MCTLQLYRKLILLECKYGFNHSYLIFLQFFLLRRSLLTKQQSRILFVVWKKGSKINIACMRRALMQTLGWNHFWRKISISIPLNFYNFTLRVQKTSRVDISWNFLKQRGPSKQVLWEDFVKVNKQVGLTRKELLIDFPNFISWRSDKVVMIFQADDASKKKLTKLTLLLWCLRLTCFCLLFGRTQRHQKTILKLIDL